MAEKAKTCPIVGVSEIATLLGVRPRTPHVWKYRGLLPPPDWESVNCCEAWNRSTIIEWADQGGRLPDELKAEARKLAKAKKV